MIGVVVEKNTLNYFIALNAYNKEIKYKLPMMSCPKGLTLDLGDSINFELTAQSTKDRIELCNVTLHKKEEYKIITDIANNQESDLVAYPRTKFTSLLIKHSKEINPLDWQREFEHKFKLRFIGVAKSYTSNGQKIVYDDNFIFKSLS